MDGGFGDARGLGVEECKFLGKGTEGWGISVLLLKLKPDFGCMPGFWTKQSCPADALARTAVEE